MGVICTHTSVLTKDRAQFVYACICRLQKKTMASSLEQLKKFTTVVADTGDIKRKEVDLTLYISSYVVH